MPGAVTTVELPLNLSAGAVMRSLLDGEPKKIIFIDRCSTFSANQLNLIGSSGAEAVIPLDLAHHGYDLAASSKGALRISDSEAEQAQLRSEEHTSELQSR